MSRLLIFPCEMLGVKVLIFPEEPWTISGWECTCWDRTSGHGSCLSGARYMSRVLTEEEALDLVKDYVKWYQVEQEVEIVYEWQDEYDVTRVQNAVEYVSKASQEE